MALITNTIKSYNNILKRKVELVKSMRTLVQKIGFYILNAKRKLKRFRKTLDLRLIQTMRLSLIASSMIFDVKTETAGGLIVKFLRDF